MERITSKISLFATLLVLQSCGSFFPTGRSRTTANDTLSTIPNTSIVGTSNTPGSSRTGYFGLPLEPTESTANTTGPSPSSTDITISAQAFEKQRFIRLLYYTKIINTQLGTYALSRTINTGIQTYTNSLLKLYGQLDNNLKLLPGGISAGDFDLSQSAGDDLNKKLERLKRTSNEEFDGVYKKMIIKENRDAVKLLEKGSKFQDKAVAELSIKYLPELRSQLKLIIANN